MSEETETLKQHSSVGTWITTIVILLVVYVASPPFVLKLITSTSHGSPPTSGGSLEKAFTVFYWPLIQLEKIGLRDPLEHLYEWESRLIGLH